MTTADVRSGRRSGAAWGLEAEPRGAERRGSEAARVCSDNTQQMLHGAADANTPHKHLDKYAREQEPLSVLS